MDTTEHKNTIVPSQGVHLVLDRKFLQGDAAIMIPKTSDGRVLFAVPWHGKVIVETTDTQMHEPSIEPRALFLDARASLEMAEETASLMATELRHDSGWAKQQVDAYRKIATGYVLDA